jgi:hypothetical protein
MVMAASLATKDKTKGQEHEDYYLMPLDDEAGQSASSGSRGVNRVRNQASLLGGAKAQWADPT